MGIEKRNCREEVEKMIKDKRRCIAYADESKVRYIKLSDSQVVSGAQMFCHVDLDEKGRVVGIAFEGGIDVSPKGRFGW
jgi:uncharacterized protein YuzE